MKKDVKFEKYFLCGRLFSMCILEFFGHLINEDELVHAAAHLGVLDMSLVSLLDLEPCGVLSHEIQIQFA